MTTPTVPSTPELSTRHYRGEYLPHEHAHPQVLLGLHGSLQLEVDGHAAFVDASCGLVIPAGARHAYLATSPAEVMVLDCPPLPGIARLRRFALPSQCRPGAGRDALQLLDTLADTRTLQTRRRLDLEGLRAQVSTALHRPWTLHDLASLSGFSAPRLRARFAELAATSPMDWLRQLRLDEAERQLRAGLPLEAVALAVGYASAAALSFALRRERATGARQLRRSRSTETIRASLES